MRWAAWLAVVMGVVACGESAGDGPASASGGSAGTSTGGASGSAGTAGDAGTGGGSAGTGGGSGSAGSSGGAGAGGAPERVWGVTVDAIDPLADITASLQKLPVRPTTRIVFDEFVPATDYVTATKQIHTVSDVMGEILDSFYVSQYSVSEYQARTSEYLTALSADVDIWEIGNEVNGEWLCAENASNCTAQQTKDVVAKIQGAHDLVVQKGGKTALTLYYNEDCWSDPKNEMFTWAAANLSPALRQELDWVLVSYYEDDCNDLQPDWQTVFSKLATLFPNAKLGIGECGTVKPAKKAEYVTRYYTMQVSEPRFIGGFFWWYYRQDMVPFTKPLHTTLSDTIQSQLP
ncbi:MAG: hypothetical protein H6717_34360 [Polyangiaceae bacterium]|nr:hypothetical protein [Polyangiaceae bacterium]